MTDTTPLITGVDFVCIPAQDFAAMTAFYGETLGLPFVKRYGSRPGAEYQAGNLTLAIMRTEDFGGTFSRNAMPIALQVSDVAVARERLEAQGVRFVSDTFDSGVCWQAICLDPDGNPLSLHHRYARLHRTWQTPWVATAVLTVFGLALLCLSSFLPTVNQIMKDSVSAIGFHVAFYYALASFACAWNTRRAALTSPTTLVALVLWPVASALFLTFVAIYSIPTFDLVTNIMGLGGIVAGLVPLFLNRWRLGRAGSGAGR